uniref:Uncharacterized protein n=1 Tax=Anguilla anguilla TaxID=7936 RepID=A0A0E9QD14_ANGAN
MQHLMYKDSTTHFIDTGTTLQSRWISSRSVSALK